jgi:phosphatidylglycerophosphatase A
MLVDTTTWSHLMSNPTIGFLLSSPGRFLAIGCGLGLSPKAPGTVGTLGGFVLAAALLSMPVWAWLAVLVLAFVGGCYICDEAGRALGVPDHGGIVWDEIVAFALVLMCVPATPGVWVAAFVLFRMFDILKPWPISVADSRFKNGFGVMLDDLLAAGFAIAALRGGLFAWQMMIS